MPDDWVRRSATVTVDRPVEDVFAVLSDVEMTPRWHPATVEEYWTTGGSPGVGSERVAVARSFGVRSENTAVVTVYEPNDRLGLRSVDSPLPFDIEISLTTVDGGTIVDWLVGMKREGPLGWFVGPALSAFMRQLGRGLDDLKSLMEGGEL